MLPPRHNRQLTNRTILPPPPTFTPTHAQPPIDNPHHYTVRPGPCAPYQPADQQTPRQPACDQPHMQPSALCQPCFVCALCVRGGGEMATGLELPRGLL
eukprot:365706-Chlamydomonas_euryale.AAC.20